MAAATEAHELSSVRAMLGHQLPPAQAEARLPAHTSLWWSSTEQRPGPIVVELSTLPPRAARGRVADTLPSPDALDMWLPCDFQLAFCVSEAPPCSVRSCVNNRGSAAAATDGDGGGGGGARSDVGGHDEAHASEGSLRAEAEEREEEEDFICRELKV